MTTTSSQASRDFWIGIDAVAYELPGPPVDIEAWAAERDYPADRKSVV